MKDIKRFKYKERICECCGSKNREELWKNELKTYTQNHIWNFNLK